MAQLTRRGTIATLCSLRSINLSSTGCYTRNAAGQVTESKGLAVPAVESGSESYSIDAASNQLAVRGGTSYTYDAAGRLLSDGIRSFGWDALGRLKTVRRNGQEAAGYGYDSQNRRVRKTGIYPCRLRHSRGYFPTSGSGFCRPALQITISTSQSLCSETWW